MTLAETIRQRRERLRERQRRMSEDPELLRAWALRQRGSGGRKRVSAPPPDPDPGGNELDSLFASGQVGGWYDPSDLNTMFQDREGTVLVTAAGQPVLRINDKSPNGFDLIANSGGTPATYGAAGGLHWLELSGGGEPNGGYLVSSGSLTLPANHEMVLGYDNVGETRGMWWSQVGDTNSWTNIFVDGSASGLSSGFGFNVLRVDGVEVPVSTRDQTYEAINGRHVSLWSTGTDGRTASFCFASYAGAAVALTPSGRLYGMVWRSALTLDETTLVESYMATKSGVTL